MSSPTASTLKKKYLLESTDKKIVKISEAAVQHLKTVSNYLSISNTPSSELGPIPVLTDGETLKNVVTWCEHHRTDVLPYPEVTRIYKLPRWDGEFLKIGNEELFKLMCAADYLEADLLLKYCGKKAAMLVAGKETEEIRKIYGFDSDEKEKKKEEEKDSELGISSI